MTAILYLNDTDGSGLGCLRLYPGAPVTDSTGESIEAAGAAVDIEPVSLTRQAFNLVRQGHSLVDLY